MPGLGGSTSTASSGFSRTSTVASTPVVSAVRVNRKRSSTGVQSNAINICDLYYRAVVYPSKEVWEMLTAFSDCERIGRGSYGEVVRATADITRFDCEEVAIKRVEILENDEPNDWENGLRLVRELFFLKSLKHPNLSSLLCLFPNTGSDLRYINIVTKYFGEGSLSQFAPKTIHEVLAIQNQLLSALSYMHARRLLHRDVKRENVFVQYSPNGSVHVVLGDFGLSRSAVPNGMTFEVVTKPYRCPSLLLESNHYGPEIDVYAAGLVLLEMLTGKVKTTLLPNRKMALRNFIRYQLALACPVGFSDRMADLGKRIHLHLGELLVSLTNEADFEDKLAMEWSRQSWVAIETVYAPSKKVLEIARRMVDFEPGDRCTIDEALIVFGGNIEEIRAEPVLENFDKEISMLSSDQARADAVKAAIMDMVRSDSIVGPYVDQSEPVSRRTRFRRRIVSHSDDIHT
jgi:serine/threonine protein kinase